MKGNRCNFFQSAGELMKVFKRDFQRKTSPQPATAPGNYRQRVIALNSSKPSRLKSLFVFPPLFAFPIVLIKKLIGFWKSYVGFKGIHIPRD